MNRKLKFLCQASVVVLGLTAFAAASSVGVTFTNSTSNLGGPAGNGVYYYPYQLTLNGGGYSDLALNVACDDYFNEVWLGETWNANVTSGSQVVSGSLSNTMFGSGIEAALTGSALGLSSLNAQTAYEMAFVLYSNFLPNNSNNTAINEAINFAMWDLFDNGSNTAQTVGTGGVGSGTCQTAATGCADTTTGYWLELALTDSTNGTLATDASDGFFNDFLVITPTIVNGQFTDGTLSNDNSSGQPPQEYISEVPEVGTGLMLATGMLGLGLVEWRRRRQAGMPDFMGAA